MLALYDNLDFRESDLLGAVPAASDVAGMRGRKFYCFAGRDP